MRRIRGGLDRLEEKLVYFSGCKHGFIKYLENIDSTYKSLTGK